MQSNAVCGAMFCISTAYAVVPCLSVLLLSVTFVYCAETSKHIFELFSFLGSNCILVFLNQTLWQYSDWDTLNCCVECRGMKNCAFRPISGFISEMIQDRAIVIMQGQ